MSNGANGTSKVITIVTAVLSLVAALGVAFIGFLQAEITSSIEQDRLALEQARLELQTEIDRLNASMGQEELALAKLQFEAEQRTRRDNIIREYVPKLTSSNEEEKQIAVAVLFVIYPNEARDILSKVAEALNEEQAETFEILIKQAQSLDVKTGDWAVAISVDTDLDGAEWEVKVANEQGYDAVIYHKGNWFITIIGSFPTEVEAESAKITVRSTFPGGAYRETAYVVNLNSWCLQPVQKDGYWECQNQ
jgi:hypothetical protein